MSKLNQERKGPGRPKSNLPPKKRWTVYFDEKINKQLLSAKKKLAFVSDSQTLEYLAKNGLKNQSKPVTLPEKPGKPIFRWTGYFDDDINLKLLKFKKKKHFESDSQTLKLLTIIGLQYQK